MPADVPRNLNLDRRLRNVKHVSYVLDDALIEEWQSVYADNVMTIYLQDKDGLWDLVYTCYIAELKQWLYENEPYICGTLIAWLLETEVVIANSSGNYRMLVSELGLLASEWNQARQVAEVTVKTSSNRIRKLIRSDENAVTPA
jgi:hypothetical protein